MIKYKTLSLQEALKVVNAAVDYATAKEHTGIAVVVVDKNAEIIAAAKMDNRSSRYFKAALRKAYSAAVFERDTSAIVEFHAQMEAQGHKGPSDWNDSMLTTLPGGYVVMEGGDVLGAIAVAGGGGTPETTDWAIADVAFAALGNSYHHKPGHHE